MGGIKVLEFQVNFESLSESLSIKTPNLLRITSVLVEVKPDLVCTISTFIIYFLTNPLIFGYNRITHRNVCFKGVYE